MQKFNHRNAMHMCGSALLLSICLLLGHVAIAMAASDLQQVSVPYTFSPQELESVGKPPLVNGRPYELPLVIAEQTASAAAAPTMLTIDVWHGLQQNFGHIGTPTEQINVLGNVSGPAEISTLNYSVNGGPTLPLTVGPDFLRLAEPGDFNIEIPLGDLQVGANQVEITAVDAAGTQISETVTANYDNSTAWPLPYTADWSSSTNIQDIAQVVDGKWQISNGKVRPLTFDYDRTLIVGDLDWADYEVAVPFTVHSMDTSGFTNASNGAGIGMIIRWRGHYNESGEQPNVGWRRLGGLGWFRWAPDGTAGLELRGTTGDFIASNSDFQLEFGVEYMMKMSVQNADPDPAYYRYKIWPTSEPEPWKWTMEAFGIAGEPAGGSVVLLAHHVDVEFGNVTIKPLETIQSNVTIDAANGAINVAQGTLAIPVNSISLSYAERLILYPQPQTGYVFDSWSGDLTGVITNSIPAIFNVTQNMDIRANFREIVPFTITVSANGPGTATVVPVKQTYEYGDVITLSHSSDSGFAFKGWTNGPLGNGTPLTMTLTGPVDIVGQFGQPDPPISDSFARCDVGSLWTYVDPVGDTSYEFTGEGLTLAVPEGVSHDLWSDANGDFRLAPRMTQPIENVNFEVEVKFDSIPTERFQIQGIVVEQDADNLLRFDFYHDGDNLQVFAAPFLDGTSFVEAPYPVTITPEGDSLYMRVSRQGNNWQQSYSFDGENWTAVSTFDFMLSTTAIGLFAGNAGNNPAFEASIDYFENTASPLSQAIPTVNCGQQSIYLPVIQ